MAGFHEKIHNFERPISGNGIFFGMPIEDNIFRSVSLIDPVLPLDNMNFMHFSMSEYRTATERNNI